MPRRTKLKIKCQTRQVDQPKRKTASAKAGAIIASALAEFVKRPQSGSNRRCVHMPRLSSDVNAGPGNHGHL
jgi:hypothetical protein